MDIQIPPFDPTTAKIKMTPPRRTFFFKRKDGSYFPTEEREAWALYKGGHELAGVSNGVKFHQALIEANEIIKTSGFEDAQARIRLGEKEELEVALGKIEIPRDFDKLDSSGRPTNVMQR